MYLKEAIPLIFDGRLSPTARLIWLAVRARHLVSESRVPAGTFSLGAEAGDATKVDTGNRQRSIHPVIERIRDPPNGILFITPESIESLFINYPHQIPKIFHGLECVIIDELHAPAQKCRALPEATVFAEVGETRVAGIFFAT
jgi:hypothetical protein